MGLDMYLKASCYVGGWDHGTKQEKAKFKAIAEATGMAHLTTQDSPSAEVSITVCYWRKANAIHAWFVKNVQKGEDDCGNYGVEREQLVELRDLCAKVLEVAKTKKGTVQNGVLVEQGKVTKIEEEGAVITNPVRVSGLLPTQGGFFFGSTEYDEYYLQDVKHTRDRLTKILDETPEGSPWISFVYHSSW